MTAELRFLSLPNVLRIHEYALETDGGEPGIADIGLLEAALAMPESGSGGLYFHESLFAMAAAYAYHIVLNHPFVDGNKRVALTCALAFLRDNGVEIYDKEEVLYDAILQLISGEMDKSGFARLLESLASPPDSISR